MKPAMAACNITRPSLLEIIERMKSSTVTRSVAETPNKGE